MLYTNLKHIETAAELSKVISENGNVMVICGRMDTLCIPIYRIAEDLEDEYNHVKFYDMECDNPEASVFRNFPEIKDFNSSPLIVYYKNGMVANATLGIQNKDQISSILDKEFTPFVRRMVCKSDM